VNVGVVSAAAGVDAAKLVDVLVEEGLCAEVTNELLSGYTDLTPSDNSWKLP
jgi:hypothetical protein